MTDAPVSQSSSEADELRQLAEAIGTISGRCSLEGDRTALIIAATQLRRLAGMLDPAQPPTIRAGYLDALDALEDAATIKNNAFNVPEINQHNAQMREKAELVRLALYSVSSTDREEPDNLTDALVRVIDGWRKTHPDLSYYETVTVIEGIGRILHRLRDDAMSSTPDGSAA